MGARLTGVMPIDQIMVPSEAAHDCVAAIGELGLCQFKDLNAEKSAFQRAYANDVSGCSEGQGLCG